MKRNKLYCGKRDKEEEEWKKKLAPKKREQKKRNCSPWTHSNQIIRDSWENRSHLKQQRYNLPSYKSYSDHVNAYKLFAPNNKKKAYPTLRQHKRYDGDNTHDRLSPIIKTFNHFFNIGREKTLSLEYQIMSQMNS